MACLMSCFKVSHQQQLIVVYIHIGFMYMDPYKSNNKKYMYCVWCWYCQDLACGLAFVKVSVFASLLCHLPLYNKGHITAAEGMKAVSVSLNLSTLTRAIQSPSAGKFWKCLKEGLQLNSIKCQRKNFQCLAKPKKFLLPCNHDLSFQQWCHDICDNWLRVMMQKGMLMLGHFHRLTFLFELHIITFCVIWCNEKWDALCLLFAA